MSPGSSKLNPYAAAYVPLAKRGENVANPTPVHSDSSIAFEGSSSHENIVPLQPDEGHSFHDSLLQENDQDAENQVEVEMDVAYLQTQFPTVSEQSLLDVYCLNEYDLDSAFDMLSQLEQSDSVHSQNLPDSLDIGDVSEPQILPEFANLKLKEVAAATGSAKADSPKYAQPQPQDST